MGSIGDLDDEAQPFHDQPLPFPGDNCKDKNLDHFSQNTLPFPETVPFNDGQVTNFEGETQVPFEDGFETQVMDFEGETQVPFENVFETQVINFAGETQVLDDFVGFENMDTQLLDEWNNERTDKTDGKESDKTDILRDADELSDNDSIKIVGCSSTDPENNTMCKQDDTTDKTELGALCHEQNIIGEKMSFTSVRVAALRASGLAARRKARNKSSCELCSSKPEDESPEENRTSENSSTTGIRASLVHAVEIGEGALEDEQMKRTREESQDITSENGSTTGIRAPLVHAVEIDEGALDDEQMKRTREESPDIIRNSAARQPFKVDDELTESEGLQNNYVHEVNDVALLQPNEVAELSYVVSQEPGDLSQANALGFVDTFLKSNDTDFAKTFDILGSTMNKSKPVSSVKGTQSLVRKSGLESISGEAGIYDWDDNHEDEGGGEFLSRQRKVLSDNKGKGLANSYSSLKLPSSKRTVKKPQVAKIKKNLSKELDEQLDVDSLDGKKATCTEKHLEDMFSGPDTQMVAEAMEEQCFGLNVTDHESKDTNGITKYTRGGPSLGRKEYKKLPIHNSLRKRSSSSSCKYLTRKSKQRKTSGTNLNREFTGASSKQCKSSRKQHKDFDTSFISPSSGREQIHYCTPIACRTRKRSVTRQATGGNITSDSIIGLSYKKVRLSHRVLSDNGHGPVNQFDGQQRNENPCKILNKLENNPQNLCVDQGTKRKTRSSLRVATVFSSSDRECESDVCNQIGDIEGLEEGTLKCKLTDGENSKLDISPGKRSKLSVLTSTSPVSCTSSGVSASPICMGDEYLEQSCKKNLSNSLVKEIGSLVSHGSEPTSTMKESRRRRDMTNVRVLFSRHLDDDIIKDRTKVLNKLGASVATSITEATHFVTNKFVRTRNMLEAIAFGKPVVTLLWLESCEQANCCIDEKNYILRDAKKEKEFGFNMPASLAHMCEDPLLKGLKVWITPSTKPGVEILSNLVKAVHGLPVARIGRSVLKDDRIPDDLIVLSCNEDYAACLPFIEKGGAVFSSELLLNGIVTQKLEYERYRLFDDRVKKTRSTVWLKRENNQYLPVAKYK